MENSVVSPLGSAGISAGCIHSWLLQNRGSLMLVTALAKPHKSQSADPFEG